MYNRLTKKKKKNAVISENQFGFRSNHSTLMAILGMVDKITTAMDNRQFSVGVFVDLSKAFDTLNHKMLLHKFEHYGIRGIALKWFESYLCYRMQFVEYNRIKFAHLIE